jgi:hypothetical protein
MGLLRRLLTDPLPLRHIALRFLDRRLNFLPYPMKLNLSSIDRPHYGYGLLEAAKLARKLGIQRISAIEFGVGGGNGLLAMEHHAEYVRKETGVDLAIYGFDTGIGLPAAIDYRDMPWLFQPGYFSMDVEKLKTRLRTSKLLLGPVEKTIGLFCQEEERPPIGFIVFDLDYYSSTVAALKIFESSHKNMLPRVTCYFDDIVGDVFWSHNEFLGGLLAIKEFNAQHSDVKVAPVEGLQFAGERLPQGWYRQIYVAHLFKHHDYCKPISEWTQMPLAAE